MQETPALDFFVSINEGFRNYVLSHLYLLSPVSLKEWSYLSPSGIAALYLLLKSGVNPSHLSDFLSNPALEAIGGAETVLQLVRAIYDSNGTVASDGFVLNGPRRQRFLSRKPEVIEKEFANLFQQLPDSSFPFVHRPLPGQELFMRPAGEPEVPDKPGLDIPRHWTPAFREIRGILADPARRYDLLCELWWRDQRAILNHFPEEVLLVGKKADAGDDSILHSIGLVPVAEMGRFSSPTLFKIVYRVDINSTRPLIARGKGALDLALAEARFQSLGALERSILASRLGTRLGKGNPTNHDVRSYLRRGPDGIQHLWELALEVGPVEDSRSPFMTLIGFSRDGHRDTSLAAIAVLFGYYTGKGHYTWVRFQRDSDAIRLDAADGSDVVRWLIAYLQENNLSVLEKVLLERAAYGDEGKRINPIRGQSVTWSDLKQFLKKGPPGIVKMWQMIRLFWEPPVLLPERITLLGSIIGDGQIRRLHLLPSGEAGSLSRDNSTFELEFMVDSSGAHLVAAKDRRAMELVAAFLGGKPTPYESAIWASALGRQVRSRSSEEQRSWKGFLDFLKSPGAVGRLWQARTRVDPGAPPGPDRVVIGGHRTHYRIPLMAGLGIFTAEENIPGNSGMRVEVDISGGREQVVYSSGIGSQSVAEAISRQTGAFQAPNADAIEKTSQALRPLLKHTEFPLEVVQVTSLVTPVEPEFAPRELATPGRGIIPWDRRNLTEEYPVAPDDLKRLFQLPPTVTRLHSADGEEDPLLVQMREEIARAVAFSTAIMGVYQTMRAGAAFVGAGLHSVTSLLGTATTAAATFAPAFQFFRPHAAKPEEG